MKSYYYLLFVVLFACSDNYTEELKAYEVADSDLNGFVGGADQRVAYSPPPAGLEGEATNVVEAKIIKTANLLFETADVEATHQRVLELVKNQGGFAQRDNAGKGYNRIYKQMTIRVPTINFGTLIDSIGTGVAYFDQKDISRRDVTEEFVDLNARLKTKKELEKRYLELLLKAKNVTEMLEIERELATIREEIEAKEGRLTYLQDQVSFSTINLEFYTNTQETGATVSYGRKMGNALKGGWNGISNFFLSLLYLWPLVIFIGLVIYFIRRYLKRKRNAT